MDVFREFEVWLKFCFQSCCAGWNIVFKRTAMYRKSVMHGSVWREVTEGLNLFMMSISDPQPAYQELTLRISTCLPRVHCTVFDVINIFLVISELMWQHISVQIQILIYLDAALCSVIGNLYRSLAGASTNTNKDFSPHLIRRSASYFVTTPDLWPHLFHYNDVIMSAMASQTTGVSIIYTAVCSGADQWKHQSSASLAFAWEIHRWPVNSRHKNTVTPKMVSFDDVIIFFAGAGTRVSRSRRAVHSWSWVFSVLRRRCPETPWRSCGVTGMPIVQCYLNNTSSLSKCYSTPHTRTTRLSDPVYISYPHRHISAPLFSWAHWLIGL